MAWRDPVTSGQGRLDVAELDAMAADLDLVVHPPVEHELAGCIHAGQVTGAVEAPPVEGDEALARLLRSPVVSTGDAGAPDPQLPGDPDRAGTSVGARDPDDRVVQRTADGDRAAGDVGAGDRVTRGPDRRLGRSVHVQHGAAHQPQEGVGELGGERLAADQHVADIGQRGAALVVGEHDTDLRRSRLEVGDTVAADEGAVRVVAPRVRSGHDTLADTGQPRERPADRLARDAEIDQHAISSMSASATRRAMATASSMDPKSPLVSK